MVVVVELVVVVEVPDVEEDVVEVEATEARVVVVVVATKVVVVEVDGTTLVAPGMTKSPCDVWMTAPVPAVGVWGGLKYSTVARVAKATTISNVERRMGNLRLAGTDMNPTRALCRTSFSLFGSFRSQGARARGVASASPPSAVAPPPSPPSPLSVPPSLPPAPEPE